MDNKLFKKQDEEKNWITFRDRLTQLLKSYNINKANLSEQLNMSKTSITRYFIDRSPDIISLWRMADYFDTSIDWLIGRTDSRYNSIPEQDRELLNRYSVASPADKLVIQTVLQKYDIK